MPSRSSSSRSSSRLYCVLVSSSSACHQLFFFFFSPSRVSSSSSSSMAAAETETDPGNNTISAWDDDGGGGGGGGNGAAAAAAPPPISADALIGLAAVAMVLVTLLTAARLHTRWVSRRQRGWDDWAMVISWLATIPLCGLQIVMARHGAGGRAGDLAALSRAHACAQAAARVASCAAKSSVLLLHLRAFYPRALARPRDGAWRAVVAALALNAAYTLAFAVAAALAAPWTPLLAAASAANLACDAVALAVPVAAVRRLHIPPVSRAYVVAVLGAVGAVAPVAGLARLACQIVVVGAEYGGANGNGDDAVAMYTVLVALATVDQIVAVFVGCAPMIIPVWVHAPPPSSTTQQSAELLLGGKQQQQRRRARDPYSSIMGDNDDEEMWWPSSSSPSRDVAVVDEAVSPEQGTGREECEYVFKPLEPVFLSYDNGREHKLFVLFLPPLPLDSFETKGCA
ncbi:hypothetical protein F5X96DRAFT_694595 [Biscogniauxia mediterranea]|nr:hypothetical protein F5X96DRAFT_694595 [Biscogniauxia mediterranea]